MDARASLVFYANDREWVVYFFGLRKNAKNAKGCENWGMLGYPGGFYANYRELFVNFKSEGSNLSTCPLVYSSTILIAKKCGKTRGKCFLFLGK